MRASYSKGEVMPDLTQVRRLEAVSFRSFPSTSTHYDGTWAIRLTAGHPAKRLNSVNPLDPSDHSYIDARLELAKRRFDSFGRPLVFRFLPFNQIAVCLLKMQMTNMWLLCVVFMKMTSQEYLILSQAMLF